MSDESHKAIVPRPDELTLGPVESAYWRTLGQILEVGRSTVGPRLTYSLVLSRVTNDLRKHYGLEAARVMLQSYVDTMAEASLYDDTPRPPRDH